MVLIIKKKEGIRTDFVFIPDFVLFKQFLLKHIDRIGLSAGTNTCIVKDNLIGNDGYPIGNPTYKEIVNVLITTILEWPILKGKNKYPIPQNQFPHLLCREFIMDNRGRIINISNPFIGVLEINLIEIKSGYKLITQELKKYDNPKFCSTVSITSEEANKIKNTITKLENIKTEFNNLKREKEELGNRSILNNAEIAKLKKEIRYKEDKEIENKISELTTEIITSQKRIIEIDKILKNLNFDYRIFLSDHVIPRK